MRAINLAPKSVLMALHTAIGSTEADEIINFRASEEGPFNDHNKNDYFDTLIGSTARGELFNMAKVDSHYFQVIAKIDYGSASYYIRAFLSAEDRELPRVQSMELFT